MNKQRSRQIFSLAALPLLAILFVALIIISNDVIKGKRFDATEDALYTLSDGTLRLLAHMDEPIRLRLYFSGEQTRDLPYLRLYHQRVSELLEEYERHSRNRLSFESVEPQPFSEEEDQASAYGLQPVPLGEGGESIYFGLVGSNQVDSIETIAFFHPDREEFLEYDLSRLIYTLSNPDKPVVGLLSSLPMGGGFDPMTRQPQEPWVIYQQLDEMFEIRQLDATQLALDDDIDLLIMVHPKNLDDLALYAIDQFALRGGRVLIFLDPHSDADSGAANPMDPMQSMMADKSSQLTRLLEAWGVEMPAQVLLDDQYALQVSMQNSPAPIRHLAILSLDDTAIANEDVMTAQLERINVASSGYFKPIADSSTTLTPLLESSASAMPTDAENVAFLPDPRTLRDYFNPTGDHYTIAARLEGPVKSAFPQGPPGTHNPDDSNKNPAANEADAASGQIEPSMVEKENASATSGAGHLEESVEPLHAVIVADTDLLTNWLWVRVQSLFGQTIATEMANNGAFVVNAVDNLTGSSDLIAIRGRETALRPFEKVESLRREAEARFSEVEKNLKAELEQTELNLRQLQEGRSGDEGGMLLLSQEQQDELGRFMERRSQIRKELREVQHDLRRDINQLGAFLKLINILIMPLLITVLLAVIVKNSRQRKKRVVQTS